MSYVDMTVEVYSLSGAKVPGPDKRRMKTKPSLQPKVPRLCQLFGMPGFSEQEKPAWRSCVLMMGAW